MNASIAPAVLDSSAVLALLFNEPGAIIVQDCLDAGIMSVVNAAEVLARLSDRGTPPDDAKRLLAALGLDLRSMDVRQAQRSAEFRAVTRSAGLSLGDRACLALAAELGLPALTADRQWVAIAGAVGVAVELIR